MYNMRQTKHWRMDLTLQLWIYVFIIYCLTFHAYADTCKNMKVAPPNRKLSSDHRVKKVVSTTLKWCADMCVYVTDCQSLSYSVASNDCELYNLNSTSATLKDYVTANNTAFMDISSWIQGRTGGCWEKPCGPSTLCTPNNELATCIPYGCALYDLPEHGWDNLNRSEEFVNVGRKVRVGCDWPYMATFVDPKFHWNVYCYGNWIWSWTYRCYTVEELCTHHILEPLYNNLTITVSGQNQLDGRQILFTSPSGWTWIHGCENEGYVQVTFGQTVWIGGLATKGHGDNGTWMTDYAVSHSVDCVSFTFYPPSNGTGMFKVFKGNYDPNSIHRNFFEEALKVRCVRVVPITGCSMRLEMLTCKDYTNVD